MGRGRGRRRGRRAGLTQPPRGTTSSEPRSGAAAALALLTWPAAPAPLGVRRGARAPLGERSGPAAHPARLLNESPARPGSCAAPPPASRPLAPPRRPSADRRPLSPAPLSRPRARGRPRRSPARPRCSASPPLEPPRNCRVAHGGPEATRMLFGCAPWGGAGCVCSKPAWVMQ